MATNRNLFGMNVLHYENPALLEEFCREYQPNWMLFYDYEQDQAISLRPLSPNTNQILRDWPDHDLHKTESPENWIKRMSGYRNRGFWCYLINEPPYDVEMLSWTLAVVKLCIQTKTKVVIFNLSIGSPDPNKWNLAKEILRLAGEHPDLIVIGLHEYAGGVITSGLIGGYPNAVTIDGQVKNLIPAANWPAPERVHGMTKWHMGRLAFLLQYLKDNGMKPVRIVVTEAGFDHLSDIHEFLKKLVTLSMTAEAFQAFTSDVKSILRSWWYRIVISIRTRSLAATVSIDGWQTLRNQWAQWFPDWDAETAYLKQLIYGAEAYWWQPEVEGVLLFAWTNTKSWSNYNVAYAARLIRGLIAWRKQEIPAPSEASPQPAPTDSKPVVVVKPTTLPDKHATIVHPREFIYLRADAGTTNPSIGKVLTGEEVLYHSTTRFVGVEIWYYVVRSNPTEGESRDGWICEQQGAVKLNEIVTIPPSQPTPNLRIIGSENNLYQHEVSIDNDGKITIRRMK